MATHGGGADLPPRLSGIAYRILPQTHNRESGYAAICVGKNGKVYVGTAKYGVNAYLVELDPSDGTQRVVVDTHELCGLSATGFAAQSKIHTRLFAAPSGTIYFGSKQGHPAKGESMYSYLGGYLMSYDPVADQARNLGKIPFRGHGVYDVVADEGRGLLHVTTCADELDDYFWYRYDMATARFQGLGVRLHTNAHPLLGAGGRVYVLTRDGQLACHDPDTDELTVRPLVAATGERFAPTNGIYQCEISPDGNTAYLLPWREPILYAVDLSGTASEALIEERGRFADVEACGTMDPCFGPDGKLYILSGWREGEAQPDKFLHIVTYDPVADEIRDEGILTVVNPDDLIAELDPSKTVGKPPYHGVRRLTDGTLYPRYPQGIAAGADGTLYVMTLNPLIVLRIDALRNGAGF